jgi:hypothetical protein
MRRDPEDRSLLVSYAEAEKICGADVLNQAIADGRIRAFTLNNRRIPEVSDRTANAWEVSVMT